MRTEEFYDTLYLWFNTVEAIQWELDYEIEKEAGLVKTPKGCEFIEEIVNKLKEDGL